MAKTAITKIVVKMGDREQTLTIEQARELQEVLNSLFGKPKEVVRREYYPVYPQPYKPYWRWNDHYISCAGTTIGTSTGFLSGMIDGALTAYNEAKASRGTQSTSYMKLLNASSVEVKLSGD